jgi:hypothetical protein
MESMQGLHEHLPEWIFITFSVAVLLINLLFALGVLQDAHRLHDKGHGPLFVGPNVWFFGVLFGSFLVLALYWLMHHSSLRGGEPKSGG